MKIELTKTEELNGEIWYRVFADGHCLKSFCEEYSSVPNGSDIEKEATKFYHEVVDRQKQGYPKGKTIISTEI